ncbi:anthranilate synthase family protein [Nocardioides donggukensis]|uniref:anthranilate synthase n=1 Tax=Nocardioides donggukensis TaxID=2774019 RepID=A0A927K1L0_9ACTN|nr:chorismate-binding protein [Nocardioides donggukensis]MBD8868144.1 chorismate-binding protein [Nocardioides donggukensis]
MPAAPDPSAPDPAAPDPAALLEELRGREAWAVVRLRDSPTVTLLGGSRSEVGSLLDVPLEEGPPPEGRRFDRLVAVPFRQVRERGFEAHDDGAPLVVVDVDTETEVPYADLLAALPDVPVTFSDRGGFETSDADYATVVERIIAEEIGNGEGANLVVARNYRAEVESWDAGTALTVLRRLFERERGAYWTYCFFTGDRYLIGASPERHVSVHGGDVRMNPISGTFRIPRGPDADGGKQALLDFLADEKEIYELFMVVDEELKMMCDICNEGGQVLGPFLKPMTHLVHTEYLLAGRTSRDVREVLRDTMYAATVTGSPVENACRLITEYETQGRGYYGAALALFGRDADGAPTADSPIVIRTADVSPDGALRVSAGATLVRDSDPAYEVAETHAKAGGILSAFGLVPAAPVPADDTAALTRDEDVLIALNSRNQRLSTFWLTDQGGTDPDPSLRGRSVVILDGEDDFVNMLRHVLGVIGMTSRVVRHEDYAEGVLDGADLVIVGPGPGDPRDGDHPKIAAFRAATSALLASGRPFLAVCLGHQTLCHLLGIPLAFKDIVFQGTQSPVSIDGRTERVGFYNTFVGRAPEGTALPEGVGVEVDPATGDVHLVSGSHYRGIQFHAESILTQHGFRLIHDLVRDLLA